MKQTSKKQKETTALAQHIKEHKHTADANSVNIVGKGRKSSTRYTIEFENTTKDRQHDKQQRRH